MHLEVLLLKEEFEYSYALHNTYHPDREVVLFRYKQHHDN
jgi:hypothetical protein